MVTAAMVVPLLLAGLATKKVAERFGVSVQYVNKLAQVLPCNMGPPSSHFALLLTHLSRSDEAAEAIIGDLLSAVESAPALT
jgi:hypothetical protein